jgi:hypothetical protein
MRARARRLRDGAISSVHLVAARRLLAAFSDRRDDAMIALVR